MADHRLPAERRSSETTPFQYPSDSRAHVSRRTLLRRGAIMIGAVAVCSTLGACTRDAVGAGGTDSLTIVVDSLPSTVDPHLTESLAERRLARLLFTPLVGLFTWDGLATGWERLGDDRWRFFLRRGFRSDGEDIATADTVRWNVLRLARLHALGGAPQRSWTWPIGAEAITTDTVDLIFEPRAAVIPAMFSNLYIVPPGYYGTTPPRVVGVKPRGSGPYAVETWNAAEQLTLRRIMTRGTDEAVVDLIRWAANPTAGTRFAMVIARAADIACDVD